MKAFWKKIRGGSIVVALLYSLFGIFLIAEAKTAGNLICYALGILLVTTGVVEILLGIHRRSVGRFYQFYVGIGLILLCVGVLIVISPNLFQMILSWIFGGLLLGSAISNFLYGMDLKEFGGTGWWVSILLSVLKIVGAVILFTHTVGEVLFIIAGVFLLIGGLSDLVMLIILAVSSGRTTVPTHREQKRNEPVDDDPIGTVIDAEEGKDYRDADDE